MLRDGFGGLIPVVKGSLIRRSLSSRAPKARTRCGRAGTAVETRLQSVGARNATGGSAALLAELSEVLAGRARDGTNEAFWREQLAIISGTSHALSGDVRAIGFTCGRRAFRRARKHPGRGGRSRVANTSAMARAMDKVIRQSARPEVLDAVSYFARSFPTHGDRLQAAWRRR